MIYMQDLGDCSNFFFYDFLKRLLNLKNDLLRKRYDSIKYDLKKIEEVVYDINIRKLSSDEK